MPTTHKLDAAQVHKEWNNAIPPRLTIDPGDSVVFDTRDASDHYYSRKSTHADVLGRGPFSQCGWRKRIQAVLRYLANCPNETVQCAA